MLGMGVMQSLPIELRFCVVMVIRILLDLTSLFRQFVLGGEGRGGKRAKVSCGSGFGLKPTADSSVEAGRNRDSRVYLCTGGVKLLRKLPFIFVGQDEGPLVT